MTPQSKKPINVSADFIRSYYYLEFDQKKQNNSGIVIDDACYELMFVKENDVELITGDKQVFQLPSFYTLNHLKGPFKFEFPQGFSSFCVKLQPWMNASFVPIKEAQVIDLNTFYTPHTNKLHETIFNAETLEEKVVLVEDFLLALNIQPNKEVELIKNICNRIYQSSGKITVAEIADEFNVYRQKLNVLFKQEVKYTLKTFINNIRIRSCLAFKLKNPKISLTEIAYHFGFFDQAHFIRSFKNACGLTPSEYIKSPGYSFLIWEQDQL